ncbi:ATP-binding protein [Actinospica sp. MGRD01-02]|uniref:ATP-binding protein n=1 Tax=Actinospica acidithermotolerans TaxID=2828514 RepID=A0A941IHQ2_9ACTN|nr:ATP-binding protein [Actinospica acidithermotolerans]MBR7825957.1 ATP-binding protein [Actinospica acidithermotolerans]
MSEKAIALVTRANKTTGCPVASRLPRPIDRRLSSQADFAAIPGVTGLSRGWLGGVLDHWDADEESIEIALLLVSELVTNAAIASGRVTGPPVPLPGERVSTIVVRATAAATRLRVEVWDSSLTLPTVKHVDVDSEDGRGLFLVEELSHEWGCRPGAIPPREEPGKIVWFSLSLARPLI